MLDGVHEAVERINSDVLPKGMRIVPFYDRTRLVDTTLTTVVAQHARGRGAGRAGALALPARALSGSLAVAITMPLALLTAFVGLYYAGVPANLLSMGAIDFGILLDGAVILVENVYRHLAEEQPRRPRTCPTWSRSAAKEVVRPTLFSMSIIVAAMMPIFTLERVEGRIFRPVALTYAFALAGALFFTLTCVPALTAVLLRTRKVEGGRAGVPGLAARALPAALRRGAALTRRRPARRAGRARRSRSSLVPRLGTEFLPEMNEGDIHITVTMPSETSLERGAEVLREMRLALLQFPEVSDVLTEQGHPEDGTDDEAPNQAETFVIDEAASEWHTGRTKEQIVDAMRAELEKRPGIDYNFSQPIKDRVEESISGIRGQIVVKIYGDDLTLMQEQARGGEAHPAARTRGARDVEVYRAGNAQHIVADIDRDATSRASACRCATSRTPLESAYGGKLATSLWEGERKVGVRVKLPAPEEGDTYAVGTPGDPRRRRARCRSSSLANVHVDLGRTQINREQGGRFLALKMQHRGARHGLVRRRGAGAREASEVKLPEGYYMTWGGEFENQRRAMKRLMVIVPISVLRHLRAALPDVPRGAAGGGGAARRAVRDGRRRLRAVPDAHRALGVGGGRLHHALRRGRHGRRSPHHLRAPGARDSTARRARTPSSQAVSQRLRPCS